MAALLAVESRVAAQHVAIVVDLEVKAAGAALLLVLGGEFGRRGDRDDGGVNRSRGRGGDSDRGRRSGALGALFRSGDDDNGGLCLFLLLLFGSLGRGRDLRRLRRLGSGGAGDGLALLARGRGSRRRRGSGSRGRGRRVPQALKSIRERDGAEPGRGVFVVEKLRSEREKKRRRKNRERKKALLSLSLSLSPLPTPPFITKTHLAPPEVTCVYFPGAGTCPVSFGASLGALGLPDAVVASRKTFARENSAGPASPASCIFGSSSIHSDPTSALAEEVGLLFFGDLTLGPVRLVLVWFGCWSWREGESEGGGVKRRGEEKVEVERSKERARPRSRLASAFARFPLLL